MDADKRASRFAALGLAAVVLMTALALRLWFLQAVDAPSLELRVQANKTRTVKLLPERGRIFDREGRILADNERLLTVTLDWEVMRRDEDRVELFERLAPVLNVPFQDLEDRYQSGRYSPLLPMPLKEGVGEDEAIYLIQRVEDFPGVDVTEEWRREYPYAPIAAHVLGYLGAISEGDSAQYLERGYNLNERVGQFGVEKVFETYLRGTPGFVKYEVDSRGAILDVVERRDPIPGNDLVLAIDLDYQQFAEQALESQLRLRRFDKACQARVPVKDTEGQVVKDSSGRTVTEAAKPFVEFTNEFGEVERREVPDCANFKAPAGSVVMMDYSTGQVLAMASYPTFDNRWFNAQITGDKFQQIFPRTDDPDLSILVNRAIQGQYNLGSSFKPFVAYAALNTGQLSGPKGSGVDYVYEDEGVYEDSTFAAARARSGDNNLIQIGTGDDAEFFSIDEWCALNRCFYRNAICSGTGKPCVYGEVNVEDALAVSSDTFFYKIGDEIFRFRQGFVLQEEVRKFGFGNRTGIDLPYESAGRVPDAESKSALVKNGALQPGEDEKFRVGDNIQLSIGQGLLAASPIQLAVAYGALGNGGDINRPLIALALLEPGTPNSTEVGMVDLSRSTIALDLSVKNTIRTVAIPPEIRDPILRGLSRVITGPGVDSDYYHSTTGEKLFSRYPYERLPIAGKTGTAQGAASLPWNDSSVFAAFSLDPNQPIVAAAYLEKAGYGSRAAAPVVKCMFLAYLGDARMSSVLPSNPLDLNSTLAAPERKLSDGRCLAGANYGGRD
ncbi:MAG: penicillin-binding transpeptidase domain-containing protein [Ilumatobacteraceae bacterium]